MEKLEENAEHMKSQYISEINNASVYILSFLIFWVFIIISLSLLFQSQLALKNEKLIFFEEQYSIQEDLIKNSETTLATNNNYLQKVLKELADQKV